MLNSQKQQLEALQTYHHCVYRTLKSKDTFWIIWIRLFIFSCRISDNHSAGVYRIWPSGCGTTTSYMSFYFTFSPLIYICPPLFAHWDQFIAPNSHLICDRLQSVIVSKKNPSVWLIVQRLMDVFMCNPLSFPSWMTAWRKTSEVKTVKSDANCV